jgi:hypothetical protein
VSRPGGDGVSSALDDSAAAGRPPPAYDPEVLFPEPLPPASLVTGPDWELPEPPEALPLTETGPGMATQVGAAPEISRAGVDVPPARPSPSCPRP